MFSGGRWAAQRRKEGAAKVDGQSASQLVARFVEPFYFYKGNPSLALKFEKFD
jgi:hypothetical protein